MPGVQRIINIPNRIIKHGIFIDTIALNNAATDLSQNAFKLWIYLHKFPQGIDLRLSNNNFVEWSNTSDSTYDRAFQTLKDKGYLISTSEKNYYIFIDNPKPVKNNDIAISTKENTVGTKGEQKVAELLNTNNIEFLREASFGTCIFKDTGYPARFDFYIPQEKYIIEYDGKQHFHREYGEEIFIKTQEHDEFKNNWCRKNNIPLIRIPYTKFNTLCIEDLMLETTEFRVV